MCAKQTSLPLYCELRWLSQGNVLTRVSELRNEFCEYLTDEKHNVAHIY